MPIRPEMKARYPADWSAIRKRIRSRAKDRCERCGAPNGAWGYRRPDTGTFVFDDADNPGHRVFRLGVGWVKIVRVVCQLAHRVDRDPGNCADDNLLWLCDRCHLVHDRYQHAANASHTRAMRMLRRQPGLAEEAET